MKERKQKKKRKKREKEKVEHFGEPSMLVIVTSHRNGGFERVAVDKTLDHA